MCVFAPTHIYPIAFGLPATVPYPGLALGIPVAKVKQWYSLLRLGRSLIHQKSIIWTVLCTQNQPQNVMKNRTERAPIFKNAPRFVYRCLALFPSGGDHFLCIFVSNGSQNGSKMVP